MYTQHYLPEAWRSLPGPCRALSRLMRKHCEDPETSYTTLTDLQIPYSSPYRPPLKEPYSKAHILHVSENVP